LTESEIGETALKEPQAAKKSVVARALDDRRIAIRRLAAQGGVFAQSLGLAIGVHRGSGLAWVAPEHQPLGQIAVGRVKAQGFVIDALADIAGCGAAGCGQQGLLARGGGTAPRAAAAQQGAGRQRGLGLLAR
jgi:hypothetical protein